ncbi:MAG TPA: TRAP transporter small permease subunit [Azoarcus taiwanensis]|mgnify:CR=1 FL=1|uniref:TRAP transporter small permease protein n=1 Tax=Azoarcus taiwanensis TaxID=666964 RepID=A0A972J789_9RHOO|nr:TRAP transporter small permease subunit [Azoarcus taiwanensis]NMG01434.1 TRAP transporter small permease subunit [Azoarcus taiwanensis]HRQ58119.1 TRAP transporter small permease subunit [Azoarcus taiwanensis]
MVLKILAFLMRAINMVNKIVGNVFSTLALGIVLVCFAVVVERYLFSTTRLWMQDLYVWLNGAMFTAVAGYALFRNQHVRVDIFYRPASNRRKAIADLIGVCAFLLPFMYIVTTYSMTYVQRSWRFMEGSANVGGMPGLYILKSFLFVFTALVALQGLAMLIRSVLILANREDLVPADFRYQYDDKE